MGLTDLTVEFYAEDIPRNLGLFGLFAYTLNRFVQYDAEKRFFVLGPKNSGKSLFLIGAYLTALRSTGDWDPNPSEELISMVSEIDRDPSGWGIDATTTDEVRDLGFQYVHGDVFPMNIQVSSLDYSGEYLSRLPDAITGAVPESDLDEVLTKLKNGVESADFLLLILDCERFINEESLDIESFFSILEAVNGQSEMLIATKADFLAEEFYNEQGLEAHQYPEDFRQYVNDRLRRNAQADSLVQQTGNKNILPVYYQTKEAEDGERIPLRDDQGDVVTVGFETLLEELAGW